MTLRDSIKPWAVLRMVDATGQILPQCTRYFWTRAGATLYACRIDKDPYRSKVVRNR